MAPTVMSSKLPQREGGDIIARISSIDRLSQANSIKEEGMIVHYDPRNLPTPTVYQVIMATTNADGPLVAIDEDGAEIEISSKWAAFYKASELLTFLLQDSTYRIVGDDGDKLLAPILMGMLRWGKLLDRLTQIEPKDLLSSRDQYVRSMNPAIIYHSHEENKITRLYITDVVGEDPENISINAICPTISPEKVVTLPVNTANSLYSIIFPPPQKRLVNIADNTETVSFYSIVFSPAGS